jgi:hypothetical protein
MLTAVTSSEIPDNEEKKTNKLLLSEVSFWPRLWVSPHQISSFNTK